MDCGGFIALFTLAARALGVASVVQASVTGYAPIIRQSFWNFRKQAYSNSNFIWI